MTNELEHSPLGASSMHRWSVCPGSIRASANAPDYESPYALEGTYAHELAAHCLEFEQEPVALVGGALTHRGKKFEVTQEMAEAVTVYTDYCRAETGDQRWIEHRFDLSQVYPGCFGTNDFATYCAGTRFLEIVDYKHGAGKFVEVKGNPQLRYYALGALMTLPIQAEYVKLTIVQPRCLSGEDVIRSEIISAVDLLEFAADLVMYAKATEDPNAPLVPGDHCQFCKALPTCPEYQKRTQAVARQEFGPVEKMSSVQLAEALAMVPLLKAWCSAIDERAYAEAMAGRKVPGYKLVDKRATRRWAREADVIEGLQDMGVGAETLYERKLKSPAQLEKALGKGVIDQWVVKESSGTTLVPEDDKRMEVQPNPDAKTQFLPV
jgi:hypothetical protein